MSVSTPADVCGISRMAAACVLMRNKGSIGAPSSSYKSLGKNALVCDTMSILPLGEIPLEDLYRLLQPITLPSTSSRARFSNWGQTYHCKPLAVFEPETEWQCELILELARREKKVVRAVGVGHSPSDLACTRGFMLRTEKFNRVLEVRY